MKSGWAKDSFEKIKINSISKPALLPIRKNFLD